MHPIMNTLTILGGGTALITGLLSLNGDLLRVAGAGALVCIAAFFIAASSYDIIKTIRSEQPTTLARA